MLACLCWPAVFLARELCAARPWSEASAGLKLLHVEQILKTPIAGFQRLIYFKVDFLDLYLCLTVLNGQKKSIKAQYWYEKCSRKLYCTQSFIITQISTCTSFFVIHCLTHFLDLMFALGLYSCTSSSSPFCLLYQSNKVRRMEGRQYSAKELMVLISCGSQMYSTVNIPERDNHRRFLCLAGRQFKPKKIKLQLSLCLNFKHICIWRQDILP